MKKIVQTAGRNALNEFAPQFAQYFTGKSSQKHLGNTYKFFEKGIVSKAGRYGGGTYAHSIL